MLVRVHADTGIIIAMFQYLCVRASAWNVLWAQDCQNLNQFTEHNDDRDY